jgi:hypothetical protein
MYTCVLCICVGTFLYVHVSTLVCMRVCMYYACMRVCAYVCIMYLCTYVFVHVCLFVCVCVSILTSTSAYYHPSLTPVLSPLDTHTLLTLIRIRTHMHSRCSFVDYKCASYVTSPERAFLTIM